MGKNIIMKNFTQLKKNLKKDFSPFKKIKVAVLGDSATQFLTQALRGTGYDFNMDLQIWEADFNQIERQVFDTTSELYKYNPEIVVLFRSSQKLLGKYNKIEPEMHGSFANNEVNLIETLFTSLTSTLNCKVIYYNYNEIDDAVFGNYANTIETSFLYQLRKLNYELMVFASKQPNLYLIDLSTIQNRIGKTNLFQASIYINTDMVLSIDALPEVANRTVELINVIHGKFKKCIILDLDNTMWGGVIGDDGVENIQVGDLGIGKAFSEFQYWVKKLKNRGIIIAVCSKNTESVAKEPFEKHPEMILRLDDIAVFIANWENKADNIREIQRILNIGFDSMVFIDDNPFERNIVRENIPDICVPELPEDPADYLDYLYSQNLFETISFSGEDTNRTKLYQNEAKRINTKNRFTNVDDFLKSLHMQSVIKPFDAYNTPRVAQLSQRSNQFNLRTIRYTEDEIEKIANSSNYFTFVFSLNDKFGDNGLISVIILRKEDTQTLFIDTWFMSCRVLKRGMENFVLNTIAEKAKYENYKYLKGEYIPTVKNEMVKDHYKELGFEKAGKFWLLDIEKYKLKECFIKQV